jgi:hypothetical protein
MTRSLAIAITVVMTLAARASARPRIALPPFDGDPGGEVQDAVTDALDGAFSIASRREVNRLVDKLRLDGRYSNRDLQTLERELDVDAVIQGEVSSRHGHHLVHFRLFVHGKLIRGFKVEFASLRSQKFRDALRDKMVEKIADASDRGDDRRDADRRDERDDRDRDRSDRDRHDDGSTFRGQPDDHHQQ